MVHIAINYKTMTEQTASASLEETLPGVDVKTVCSVCCRSRFNDSSQRNMLQTHRFMLRPSEHSKARYTRMRESHTPLHSESRPLRQIEILKPLYRICYLSNIRSERVEIVCPMPRTLSPPTEMWYAHDWHGLFPSLIEVYQFV